VNGIAPNTKTITREQARIQPPALRCEAHSSAGTCSSATARYSGFSVKRSISRPTTTCASDATA
jgi:hypothetical protein